MLTTEEKLPRRHGNQWSPQLKTAAHLFQYWQYKLEEKLNSRELHPYVEQKIESNVTHIDKFQGHPEWSIRKQHRKALKELRSVTLNDQTIWKNTWQD